MWVSGLKKLNISVFFQHPINVFLIRHLPLGLYRFYLRLLGFIFLGLKEKTRRNVIMGLGYLTRSRPLPQLLPVYVLKTYLGIFEHYLEKLLLGYRPLSEMISFLKPRLKVSRKHLLDKAIGSHRGVILVTGHFGAVEFLPLSLALLGYKVAIICRFKRPELKRALSQRAKRMGVKIIDANEGNVATKAIGVLKKGYILITECDEFEHWRPYPNRYTYFLGAQVPQDRTLDIFYRRARCPVILGLMKREPDGYTLCLEPLADGMEAVEISPRALATLEKYILEYPEQWYQWPEAVEELKDYIRWDDYYAPKTLSPASTL
ncbi:lysophospholipid acyltransferase family protein [Thermosulfuriphilus sp.]